MTDTSARPDRLITDISALTVAPEGSELLLEVRELSVRFGGTQVLESLSLEVTAGETLVILGESGCGKTTLLKALAGLVPTATGEIYLQGESVATRTPQQRGILYLDQEPLLFEHLNVRDNLAFAMRMRRAAAADIEAAVERLLKEIDLIDHGHKREWQLSGGQKQRVAFARAVLARPTLLLLDEPFGSLDSVTRNQMQSLFARICHQQALTAIFVTHDVKEALVVGDRFVRMTAGRLQIYSTRNDFINDPATGVLDEISFWKTINQSPNVT